MALLVSSSSPCIVSITTFSLALLSLLLASPSCFAFWVSHTSNGSLVYHTLPNGDRIMDFSSAGYYQGSRSFPQLPPIMLTLKPSGANDSQQLQQAINYVASLPLNSSTGLRGAIQLSSGHFDVRHSSFTINASGIIILGNGTDNITGTVLHAQQALRVPLFSLIGPATITEVGSWAIVKQTVPSGTKEIYVDTLAGLSVGDPVLVSWPLTAPFIEMMNMTQIWRNITNKLTKVERTIASIDTATAKITLDIPIPFRIDTQYLDEQHVAYITKFTQSRIRDVGLADFMAMQPPMPPYGNGTFLNFVGVEDSWARNLIAQDFGGDTMTIAGKRITLQDLQLIRTISAPSHGPKPADIALQFPGSQILVTNTTCVGDHEFNFLTRDEANGPNVFHNCKGIGSAKAQPHSQWATGLLYDNLLLTNGSIDIFNRNTPTSTLDQGIAAGYSVVWHSNSSTLTLLNPPGAANWAIGCNATIIKPEVGEQGYIEPNGIPSADLLSLYEAQKAITQAAL